MPSRHNPGCPEAEACRRCDSGVGRRTAVMGTGTGKRGDAHAVFVDVHAVKITGAGSRDVRKTEDFNLHESSFVFCGIEPGKPGDGRKIVAAGNPGGCIRRRLHQCMNKIGCWCDIAHSCLNGRVSLVYYMQRQKNALHVRKVPCIISCKTPCI